jgi:tagatose 1,6-diphosphate aldolase
VKYSEAKTARLNALSNERGVIAALAIDQRKSLRRMIADCGCKSVEGVADGQLSEFKALVTRALTPHASAVLLDPEYGLAAAGERAPGCGLLLAYEMDGYENPRPFKMLALMPEFSARRLKELGADGVKILLTYSPFEQETANEAKHALIERIGCECETVGLPFFLEPVGYDPQGADIRSVEYARKKPEIVIRSMEEFSRDIYHVDVLKVEFPVNAAYVEGSPVFAGTSAYTRAEALECFRRADGAAGRPYIYLSAGVGIDHFAESLGMAAEAGARYSGVLCGRATWQDGAVAYARGGPAALDAWLATGGAQNILKVNQCLAAAQPWHSFE